MQNKVILILVDGMRADAVHACGHKYPYVLEKEATYCYDSQTVSPSVTLPCHMSLFHSVEPSRHGILTNDYVPQVRPIDGLYEQLAKADKKTALYYTWEELRDLARPGSLDSIGFCKSINYTNYRDCSNFDGDNADRRITQKAVEYISEQKPDFIFIYLGDADEYGHHHGWMSENYLKSVNIAWECIERLVDKFKDEYEFIITADHGGHDRTHGTDCAEDMTIPTFLLGDHFEQGKEAHGYSILDIAPTIVDICGVKPNAEWCGQSRVK